MTDKKIKDFTKGIEKIAKLHPADQEKVFQMVVIIPELSEPPVRTLGATIPENESHIFR